MPRKKQPPVDPAADAAVEFVAPEPTPAKSKKYPKVDVLERRLADPLGSGSEAPIRLKTPIPTDVKGDRWHLRWIDSSQQGRVWDVIENKGWEKVQVSELFDKTDVTGLAVSPDGGYVTRGDKGREILVKMPQSWWERIHAAKVAAWSGAGKTRKQRKDDLADAVSTEVKRAAGSGATTLSDDEAGEMTRGLQGSVRLHRAPMLDTPNEGPEDFI